MVWKLRPHPTMGLSLKSHGISIKTTICKTNIDYGISDQLFLVVTEECVRTVGQKVLVVDRYVQSIDLIAIDVRYVCQNQNTAEEVTHSSLNCSLLEAIVIEFAIHCESQSQSQSQSTLTLVTH